MNMPEPATLTLAAAAVCVLTMRNRRPIFSSENTFLIIWILCDGLVSLVGISTFGLITQGPV